jgi:dTDP-4-dehydrorhamnose reductase
VKILVTGREGQLVRSLLARAAVEPGWELLALGRPELDLTEPGSFAAAVGRHRPDLVINAAAYTAVDQAESEPELARRINADAAGEGAHAAASAGARFIQISTDYVYAGEGSAPLREDTPVSPVNHYGRTKWEGEQQVRAVGGEHLILRTAWVVSPFGRNFVRTMLTLAQSRDELTVVDDQQGSPTSALDLADALAAVVASWKAGSAEGVGEVMHLAGSGQASWCGLASFVMEEARSLGLPSATVKPILSRDWPTPAKRPAWSVLDSSRFAAAFGFAMPHWRTSVRAIVQALATHQGR